MKFVKDRKRWLQRLSEVKRRFGLIILDFAVSAGHIHLLGADDEDRQVIPVLYGRWTKSVAAGSANFVENIKGLMGAAAMGREFIESDGSSQLREPQISYNRVFEAEKSETALENTYIWGDNRMNTGC